MSTQHEVNRRTFLGMCSAAGIASTVFAEALWGIAQSPAPKPESSAPPKPDSSTTPKPAQTSAAKPAEAGENELPKTTKITPEMIAGAAAVAGLKFPADQVQMMADNLNSALGAYRQIWALAIANSVAPALLFDPVLPGQGYENQRRPAKWSRVAAAETPKNIEDAAFYSVRQLGELVRNKRVSATNLTEMYLERLKRYDPVLHFVVTLTTDRALVQAKELDRELAAGKYRGPLHGIPWGAKDLLAVKGYPTTWGAAGFENQKFDEDATVVKRLDAAGAVLVAKLTLGALAQGDVWFGAVTRNPWKVTQGSSGSSAGPGSATAAGCVGFAIGSETLGSISSPSTRNGVTGLRPTFGFVPRTGAMALSWSMDKLGPMCRAVEDCAAVLGAIAGPDDQDRCAMHNAAFNWDAALDAKALRVGYLKSDFELPPQAPEPPREEKNLTEDEKKKREEERANRELFRARRVYDKKFDDAALEKLRSLGFDLKPVELPKLPVAAMRSMLIAEAAAAFDELTRSGRDRLLTAQTANDWPNTFRAARFIPAVEYINASRARTLLMQQTAAVFKNFDAIVAPTGSTQLLVTNMTGHPAVILPHGFRGPDAPVGRDPEADIRFGGGPGTPLSLTFLGNLFGEPKLLAVAKAYQDATGFHLKHPNIPTAPTEPFPAGLKLKARRHDFSPWESFAEDGLAFA
jgi:Asp-tRNA(Asn)/Glu-tRNA(Gln) amidotransferase A subunit family amidase